jgi:large subunit ribosomal protein L4
MSFAKLSQRCLAPRLSRSMTTETPLPSDDSQFASSDLIYDTSGYASSLPGIISHANAVIRSSDISAATTVLTTIYKFPSMEPVRFESYSSKHLYLPLRRDILHRAVIFEGDATRQGTASTKTRWEIHGSHRKLRPQKGTGMARLGSKQSPMLRGGAKAFGPRPRDNSTELPKKMYDLAWRTALSYRYRKGELIICEDGMDIDYPKTRYASQIFQHNKWGQEYGRSLIITGSFRKNLFRAVRHAGQHGRVQMVRDVDVKDLLELGRVVIEKRALDEILAEHQSDLKNKIRTAA